MSERILKKDGSDAKWCGTCRTELAASECSDAWELPDGKWEERGPRRGCLQHPVEPMVHFKNGDAVPFAQYQASMVNIQ